MGASTKVDTMRSPTIIDPDEIPRNKFDLSRKTEAARHNT
jgi:hypothetical protein